MNKYLRAFAQLMSAIKTDPQTLNRLLENHGSISDAQKFALNYKDAYSNNSNSSILCDDNPIFSYFRNHNDGNGIIKWKHYFDVYHRHFAKFVGKKVNILEIGIYSGGSLEMWRDYFGEGSRIYGVDIEQDCKKHENEFISIFIGDQEDRNFWKQFRQSVDALIFLLMMADILPSNRGLHSKKCYPI